MISDHHAVWLDIQAQHFNMVKMPVIVTPAGCQLKCQDPRIVKKYNKFLVQAIEQDIIMHKIKQLNQSTNSTNDTNNAQWELIDNHLATTKIAAERHCCKLHAGKVPWTPVVTQLIYKILYWKGIRKRLQGGKISGTVLQKKASQGVETFFHKSHLQMTTAKVKEKIKSAVQDYKQINKQSNQHNIWVAEMITAQAEAKNMTKMKQWKCLRQTEQSQNTARNVKKALGKNTAHSGLSQVMAPTSQTGLTWQTSTTK